MSRSILMVFCAAAALVGCDVEDEASKPSIQDGRPMLERAAGEEAKGARARAGAADDSGTAAAIEGPAVTAKDVAERVIELLLKEERLRLGGASEAEIAAVCAERRALYKRLKEMRKGGGR